MLENELDKAKIRQNTAVLICTKYKEIRSWMRAERRQLPAKMDTMEQAVLESKSELEVGDISLCVIPSYFLLNYSVPYIELTQNHMKFFSQCSLLLSL